VNSTVSSNNWFIRPLPNGKAETRLFLFPYAGGGPAIYGKWITEFDVRIETFIAHYPGRGSRHNEPPIRQIDILVGKLAEAIQPYLDKPFVFFGHSFGGLVAFELARQIQPQILFISGCGAPHLSNPHPPIHHLPDPEFVRALKELNGIPPEVADNPELMELLLPMLRADFEAFESYRPNARQLTCPIQAFGGLDDPRIGREQLEGWIIHTTADFRSQYFSGDHFFIHASKADILASIISGLTSSHAKG
jgi:medium-chain acyl-[acyl-carrier-protein] hydrolase